jgi:quercetin dioxygenase-like cupin family protein
MPTIPAHDVIQVGPVAVRFRVDGAQSGGHFTMFEFTVPASARVPVAHSHETFDETIYGLEGNMTWTVDGKKIEVRPGDVMFIPRGVVHGFENVSPGPAVALSVITPGVLGPSFFQDVADVLKQPGPPDIARIMGVMQRYGLRPAPPSS